MTSFLLSAYQTPSKHESALLDKASPDNVSVFRNLCPAEPGYALPLQTM